MAKNPTCIGVVAAAIFDNQGRWLMYRRPDHKQHGGLWEFPGGKVEHGETPENTLIREIEEELGIQLDAGSLRPVGCARNDPEPGEGRIVILLYTASGWSGKPAPLEGGKLGWFTPEEIDLLDKPPLDVVLCQKLFE